MSKKMIKLCKPTFDLDFPLFYYVCNPGESPGLVMKGNMTK